MHRIPLRPVLLLFCLLLAPPALLFSAAAQPPTEEGRLTFDDLFEEGSAGERPAQLAWVPDGSALSYVWDTEPTGDESEDEALWRMDAVTGETEILFSAAALADAANRTDDTIGADGDDGDAAIDAYHWAPDGGAVLVESGGDLFLWRPEGGLTRLTDTDAEEEAPSFSPVGGRIAFVREANLYVLGLDDGSERALTTDGEPGVTLNATTDWVYWEEIWGRDATGYWWSPAGDRIAYYRFDETPVGELTLLPDPTAPYPEPKIQRYPKAGTDNPNVRIGVVGVESAETVWLETDAPGNPKGEETYLARVHWMPGERAGGVAVERLNRDQTNLDLLSCDPASGGCERILREHRATWVDLGEDTTFLDDGRLLWASDRDGWRHLYLFGKDGSLIRQLTAGSWAVESVDHAGEDAAIVTAFGDGPLGAASRRILRVPYDGSGVEEVAAGDPRGTGDGPGGWHTARIAPDGRHWVHGWSAADRPGWQKLETIDGETVAELPARPPAFDPAGLPSWRFFRIPGDGTEAGHLPAALMLPPGAGGESGAASEQGIPVLMYHYGGPASQVVADRWSRGRGLWHKLMAQRGFGVLMVDNPGSLFFGKTGAERLHRRFGPVNLAAQKAGVDYLRSLDFVDPERIGLWGWSGGGSNTLYCLLNAPGTWKAGLAGAPVTDWRYYDTIWTERYLDHPEDNPDGYQASSAITYAENLEDRLLIVHGTADDNVHPQNTLAMAGALVAAGEEFEMAIYPDQKHGIRGDAERHFYEKMAAFFERWLK